MNDQINEEEDEEELEAVARDADSDEDADEKSPVMNNDVAGDDQDEEEEEDVSYSIYVITSFVHIFFATACVRSETSGLWLGVSIE